MRRALAPLRHTEFRALTGATLVSALGDGLLRVALPLQILAITDDDPLGFALVGAAWGLGHALSLPLGGVTSDRADRRTIMIGSDVVRAGVIGAMGWLGTTGRLELWHALALGLVFGVANGFFNPAARSLVPRLLPGADLARGNALLGFARPLQLWVVGPLLAGVVVGLAGPGVALTVDAVTFLLSAVLLLRLRPRPPEPRTERIGDSLRGGMDYVRRTPWARLWIAAAGLSTLAFHGPFDVLVPTMLKADLGLSEAAAGWWMGAIFAAGGVGALAASTLVGQRDLPRRFMSALYAVEIATLAGLAGFAAVTRLWQALVLGLVVFGSAVLSEIISDTTLQREVPESLLGRVVSLEWFVAVGLAPISFVVAGPLGQVFGPRPVLVTAGVLGCLGVAALALLPGALTPERRRARAGTAPG